MKLGFLVLVASRETAHYGDSWGISVARWWRESFIGFWLVLDEVGGCCSGWGIRTLTLGMIGIADFIQEVEE